MCWAFTMLSYCSRSKKQIGQQMRWCARLLLRALTEVAYCLIKLVQQKNRWRGESRVLWLPAEPRCSVPLSQSAASTFLCRLEMGQGHSTGVLQLLLLHGVGGGVMDQAPSKAWLDLDGFSPWECWTLHNHQNTFWVNDLVLRIKCLADQNTGVLPLQPISSKPSKP